MNAPIAIAATKPSGITWLGEVPAHWGMKKIRFLFRFQSGGTPSTTNEAYWEGTLPWVSAKDMKKMWISDTEDHISEHALTESAANTVPPNSILLLTRSGILQHTIPVCVNSRRMAINQDVKGCIPVADNVDVRFCAYFIHGSQEQLLPLWRQEGATVESLEFETVKNTAFALPPLPEQRAIAAFLDERTARIDGLIARKQRLVQLLKEKRQALITRAVTRGLDAKVKLKETGVPWLGELPEGWQLRPLKELCAVPITDGPHETPEFYDEGVPFVSAEAIWDGRIHLESIRGHITREDHERYSRKYLPRRNDIYMIKSGSTTGRVAIVDFDSEFNIWSPLAVVRCNDVKAHYGFVYHAMSSDYFQKQVQTRWSFGTQPNIGMGVIGNLIVALPPREEQQKLSTFIDSRTLRIDALITKVEQAVLRLQEYRTALISAAVTGKVRVGESEY